MRLAIMVAVMLALAGTAHAYPQFQLARDQTCTACHLSPAGGGLLNENGLATAETLSQFGTAPEFFYNKLGLPSWLELGGDMRGAYGYLRTPQQYLVGFPMQTDVYASAKAPQGFRVTITGGYRPPEYGNEAATYVWSREHYVMWQQNPDTNEGLYVRVGRFMPVFGLRFAEHPLYDRRYGGTQLYSETYGAAVEYISQQWEAHATGFIKDPFIDPVGHDNGAAGYGEYRISEQLSVGGEGMFTKSTDDKKYRGGITAKYYLKGVDLVLEAEGQVVNQHIGAFGLTQLVGQLLVTKNLPGAIMIDLGIGHYDENVRIKGLDRDAIDLNVHWFTTSHLELLFTGRAELINQGQALAGTAGPIGGPTGAYALLQAHYRL